MKRCMFESSRLIFRSIAVEDSDILVRWRSDYDIIKYFKDNRPLTMEKHRIWFENYLSGDDRYDFIIEDKMNADKIGFASITDVDREKKSCEIGVAIAEKSYQGKGLAKETVLSLVNFAHRRFSIDTCIAMVHHENHASIQTFIAVGFEKVAAGEFEVYKYKITKK